MSRNEVGRAAALSATSVRQFDRRNAFEKVEVLRAFAFLPAQSRKMEVSR